MDTFEALKIADNLVFASRNKYLNDLERSIIEGVCQRKKYSHIAQDNYCEQSHVNDVAAGLWKVISDAVGEQVKKSNFRSVIERYQSKNSLSFLEQVSPVNGELVKTSALEIPNLRLPSSIPKKQPNDLEIHAIRVSARNVFPAIIKQVSLGSINAEILLEIEPGVEVVSVITRSSVEALQLKEGRKAYVMIKSSDVMVAVDD
jgi:molybdopterin-binding protein